MSVDVTHLHMLDSTNASDFEAVRNHTAELIQDAAKKEEPVLIEAPPGSGKTTKRLSWLSKRRDR